MEIHYLILNSIFYITYRGVKVFVTYFTILVLFNRVVMKIDESTKSMFKNILMNLNIKQIISWSNKRNEKKKRRGVLLFKVFQTIFEKLKLYLETVITFDSCVKTTIKVYKTKCYIDIHNISWLGYGNSLLDPKFHHLHHFSRG